MNPSPLMSLDTLLVRHNKTTLTTLLNMLMAVEREYPHTPFRRFARGPPLLSHPMQKNTPGMPP